jgi:hypothetical protein
VPPYKPFQNQSNIGHLHSISTFKLLPHICQIFDTFQAAPHSYPVFGNEPRRKDALFPRCAAEMPKR